MDAPRSRSHAAPIDARGPPVEVQHRHDDRRRRLLSLARSREPMRPGSGLGPVHPWADLMAIGPRIEAPGFASSFANDHFMPVLGSGEVPIVGRGSGLRGLDDARLGDPTAVPGVMNSGLGTGTSAYGEDGDRA
jgi:hypothetical protein